MMFDPNHSAVERNPDLAKAYAGMVEDAIGHDARVIGMLEMGSFAKGEAVPTSDTDTRIYVELPRMLLQQVSGSRFLDLRRKKKMDGFEEFAASFSGETLALDWDGFNDPVAEKITRALGANVEFGLVDRRFVEWTLNRIEQYPSNEFDLLIQSNVLYDPEGFLGEMRGRYEGRIFSSLARFYQERFLDALPFEIYTHLQPHEWDAHKLKKSGQIQWVKWAVLCIRDAVASRTYIDTGSFVYKKPDVIQWFATHLPDDLPFVEELYSWKTNPEIRASMINAFVADPEPYFKIFKEKTARIEQIVASIRALG